MYLIQILLPLSDNNNKPFDAKLFLDIQHTLTEIFGGLTAFKQSPAEGLWKEKQDGKTIHDDIIIFEVLTENLDKSWWQDYKKKIEKTFKQDEIIIRAQTVILL